MAQGRNTLMDPPIEDLLDKVDSKFTLVALGSARARQVNSYYNSLGEGLGKVVPPQVASVSGKPVSIAFEEIAAGKATYTRPDPDEEAALAAAEADLAGDPVLSEVLADDGSATGIDDDVAAVLAAGDAVAVDAVAVDAVAVDDVAADDMAVAADDVAVAADDAAEGPVAEAEIEVLDVGDEDPTAS
jgi:DNA-directed RNA polymerase subunit omega